VAAKARHASHCGKRPFQTFDGLGRADPAEVASADDRKQIYSG
jgi:hypothetical protein